MTTALKKEIVFNLVITLATSTYAAFLNTVMKQGFFTDHFMINWFSLMPLIYLFLLPYVWIMGRVVRSLVNSLFRNEKK